MQSNKINGKDVFNQSEKVAVVNDNPAPEEHVRGLRKGRKINSLSHKQFLKVSDFMRCQEEQIREVEFTKDQIVKFISEGVGFPVSIFSITEVAEATGVKWARKTRERKDASRKPERNTTRAIRNLSYAIALLFKQLGVEPTEGLKTVYELYCSSENYTPIDKIETK
jgi:hypothetical protein